MKTSIVTLAALTAISLALPASGAPLSKDQQGCVNAMQKDGAAVAKAHAKQLATCVKDAQKGTITDLGACLEADSDELVTKAIDKSTADATKFCGAAPAVFGVAAAFDLTTSEAAVVHARGLATDLLTETATVPGDKAGNKCQSTGVTKAQSLVKSYLKSFTKCVRDAIKNGATDGAALIPCTAPDMTKPDAALSAAVGKACEGVVSATALPGLCSGLSGTALTDCITSRAKCRACRTAATNGGLDADCDLVDDAANNDSCTFVVSLSGEAFKFNGAQEVIPGAYIWVLEHPEMNLVTGADGHFQFDALEEGSEATLVLEHPDYHPIQTGTIRLGALGAERVTFQAVTWDVFDALAGILGVVPDEANKCQMVTTVTRVGKSMYDPGAHGEVAATVAVDPPLPEENGPIYFSSDVIPITSLTRTSDDGGALYIQVPPGEYVWTAHKGLSVFTLVKMKCRVGLLVDASPPWGLQKH
ncbi:MAG: hypothetical protein HY899_03030 [Deltaproteobacteria bacterium]|nr:hypothetical protein [Deltaproteobacteria bacterium]